MMKQNTVPFIQTQKQKQLLIKWYWCESIYIAIISNLQRSLGKGSGWIIDSVVIHTINISKYKPLAGNSFIKLIQNIEYSKY